MSEIHAPIIVIPAFDIVGRYDKARSARYLVSSLLRNLFGGKIVVATNAQGPLFKTGRTAVSEISFGAELCVRTPEEREAVRLRFFAEVNRWIEPDPRQWVVVMEPDSLVLRGIDHLFPSDHPWDVLWMGGGQRNRFVDEIKRVGWGGLGCFAVRGKAWRFVQRIWRDGGDITEANDPELKVVGFEWGEVIHPEPRCVNWAAVEKAAIVSMAGWEDEEIRSFTRCLYLGMAMGAEMETMLQIVEF